MTTDSEQAWEEFVEKRSFEKSTSIQAQLDTITTMLSDIKTDTERAVASAAAQPSMPMEAPMDMPMVPPEEGMGDEEPMPEDVAPEDVAPEETVAPEEMNDGISGVPSEMPPEAPEEFENGTPVEDVPYDVPATEEPEVVDTAESFEEDMISQIKSMINTTNDPEQLKGLSKLLSTALTQSRPAVPMQGSGAAETEVPAMPMMKSGDASEDMPEGVPSEGTEPEEAEDDPAPFDQEDDAYMEDLESEDDSVVDEKIDAIAEKVAEEIAEVVENAIGADVEEKTEANLEEGSEDKPEEESKEESKEEPEEKSEDKPEEKSDNEEKNDEISEDTESFEENADEVPTKTMKSAADMFASRTYVGMDGMPAIVKSPVVGDQYSAPAESDVEYQPDVAQGTETTDGDAIISEINAASIGKSLPSAKDMFNGASAFEKKVVGDYHPSEQAKLDRMEAEDAGEDLPTTPQDNIAQKKESTEEEKDAIMNGAKKEMKDEHFSNVETGGSTTGKAWKKSASDAGIHIRSFEDMYGDRQGFTKSGTATEAERPSIKATVGGGERPDLNSIQKSAKGERKPLKIGYGVDPHEAVAEDWDRYFAMKDAGLL